MTLEEFAEELKNDIDNFVKTWSQGDEGIEDIEDIEDIGVYCEKLTPDASNMPNLSTYFSTKWCYERYINSEIEK